ncbi:MAG: MBL fold metallo-hydrolase [Candidatus Gracilibacteria bacterium]|jgi:L-ascorbate metabolism protein UlaG (beta-lactamase superfamily)
MDITWHGNTCFVCKDRGVTVVVNPDEKAGKLKGEIVLSSLGGGTAEVEGAPKVCDWAGEYEIKDVAIIAFQAWKSGKKNEEKEGKKSDSTLIFRFDMNGFKICHLGELGHALTSDMVKEIGDADVLLMTAGEGTNLDNKKAMEILESVDPRALVIVDNGGQKDLLKELGAEQTGELEKFSLKSKSELPEDRRMYVVLKKS